MIGDLLTNIAIELNAYIHLNVPGWNEQNEGAKTVYVTSPVGADGVHQLKDNAISICLLNIEEELTLRDPSIHQQRTEAGFKPVKAPLHVHLQVLLIANYSKDYATELNAIYWVLEFFQQKSRFALPKEALVTSNTSDPKATAVAFELNTLPLRDLHYIWGNLGIKQQPSVAYRVKMLTIAAHDDPNKNPEISETPEVTVTRNNEPVTLNSREV